MNHTSGTEAIVAVKEVKDTLENENNLVDNNFRGKISDNIQNVAEKVHEKSDAAQLFLSKKAGNAEEFMRQKTFVAGDFAQQTLDKVNQIGHKAGDVLESSSEYIRNFDVAEAKESATQTIKDHPEIGIALAGTFGLLIGLIIGGRRRS